jgi:hypothetical protein
MLGSKTLTEFLWASSLICFMSASAVYAQAPAPPMKPLKTVLSELRSELDLSKASYFFMRCTGFSFATAGLLSSTGGAEGKTVADNWTKHAIVLIEYAAEVEKMVDEKRGKRQTKTPAERTDMILKTGAEMSNLYVDRMNANYVRSGNYLVDDPWLKEEMDLCRDAPTTVMKAFR